MRTARQSSVFREFHVLTDCPLEGCESYDAFKFREDSHSFALTLIVILPSLTSMVSNRPIISCVFGSCDEF